jgi:hypothetical protein
MAEATLNHSLGSASDYVVKVVVVRYEDTAIPPHHRVSDGAGFFLLFLRGYCLCFFWIAILLCSCVVVVVVRRSALEFFWYVCVWWWLRC